MVWTVSWVSKEKTTILSQTLLKCNTHTHTHSSDPFRLSSVSIILPFLFISPSLFSISPSLLISSLFFCVLDSIQLSTFPPPLSPALSLVDFSAVLAAGSVVAGAELANPVACLHHHILRNRHHDAEEVWVLERRGRQAENRLLGHQALCEFHVVLEVWEVFHINPHHEVHGPRGHDGSQPRDGGQRRVADLRV